MEEHRQLVYKFRSKWRDNVFIFILRKKSALNDFKILDRAWFTKYSRPLRVLKALTSRTQSRNLSFITIFHAAFTRSKFKYGSKITQIFFIWCIGSWKENKGPQFLAQRVFEYKYIHRGGSDSILNKNAFLFRRWELCFGHVFCCVGVNWSDDSSICAPIGQTFFARSQLPYHSSVITIKPY